MNEVNPRATMNVESGEPQRSVDNENSVQSVGLVSEKERGAVSESPRGRKCVETSRQDDSRNGPLRDPDAPLNRMPKEDPTRARLRYLKAAFGRNLQQGYVTERTKASIRINAIRFPDIFGCFKV